MRTLPATALEFVGWSSSQIESLMHDLLVQRVTAQTVESWLGEWSQVADLIDEAYWRLYIASTANTRDEKAQRTYQEFLDRVYQPFLAAEQKLKVKLLASGIEPANFAAPLRAMRAEVELFREANTPLLTEEQTLAQEFDQIVGAQTVMWEGVEVTLTQLAPYLQHSDRRVREHAWRTMTNRQLSDRAALNAIWQRCLVVRQQLAANAGFYLPDGSPDYRRYRWQQMLRFDYTPDDCRKFHAVIEQVVVPAATQIYEERRRRLGIDTLRPWDLKWAQGQATVVEPAELPPLHPFHDLSELEERCATIFGRVHPQFEQYFEVMRQEQLLDLANRKNKAPSSYCTSFQAGRRPFIFMNGTNMHEDVQTLIHEAGHAFHVFERSRLPYHQQRAERFTTSEFAEMVAVTLELLSAPYLLAREGGFYSAADAARARRAALEEMLLHWPYVAVVDAFQHWVYEHPVAAARPANCDAQWQILWQRFMTGVDWRGLEEASLTRWQRQGHIFSVPFYFIEYGLALVGAVQVWRNALHDRDAAIARYRNALALGSTRAVPDLFAAAGAKFAFDIEILRDAVQLITRTIAELDQF